MTTNTTSTKNTSNSSKSQPHQQISHPWLPTTNISSKKPKTSLKFHFSFRSCKKITLNILKIILPTTLAIILSQLAIKYLFILFLNLIKSTDLYHFFTAGNFPLFFIVTASSILCLWLIVSFLPKLIRKFSHQKPKNDLSTTREELGLTGLFTWKDILLAPLAFIATLFVGNLILSLVSLFFPQFNPNEAQELGITGFISNLDLILTAIAIFIIPPFFEEILFRGWIYGKLRSFLAFLPAALITSALFGIIHGQINVAIVTFVMSMFACLLREITGTIYASILLHIIKNAIAFYLLFIAKIHLTN